LITCLNQYPIININKTNIIDSFLKVGTSKSIDWEYEKEIRAFKLDGCGKKSFNMACLREVIFGVKCSEEDQKTIILLLSKFGYPHIKYSKAKLDTPNFQIEINEIEPNFKIEIEEEVMDMTRKYVGEEYLQQFSEKSIKKSMEFMLPKYEELFRVICNDLLSIEDIAERNKIIEQSPQNKEELKLAIEHIEKSQH